MYIYRQREREREREGERAGERAGERETNKGQLLVATLACKELELLLGCATWPVA